MEGFLVGVVASVVAAGIVSTVVHVRRTPRAKWFEVSIDGGGAEATTLSCVRVKNISERIVSLSSLEIGVPDELDPMMVSAHYETVGAFQSNGVPWTLYRKGLGSFLPGETKDAVFLFQGWRRDWRLPVVLVGHDLRRVEFSIELRRDPSPAAPP